MQAGRLLCARRCASGWAAAPRVLQCHAPPTSLSPPRCLACAAITQYTVVGVPTGGVTTAKPLLKAASVGILVTGGLVSAFTASVVCAAAVVGHRYSCCAATGLIVVSKRARSSHKLACGACSSTYTLQLARPAALQLPCLGSRALASKQDL